MNRRGHTALARFAFLFLAVTAACGQGPPRAPAIDRAKLHLQSLRQQLAQRLHRFHLRRDSIDPRNPCAGAGAAACRDPVIRTAVLEALRSESASFSPRDPRMTVARASSAFFSTHPKRRKVRRARTDPFAPAAPAALLLAAAQAPSTAAEAAAAAAARASPAELPATLPPPAPPSPSASRAPAAAPAAAPAPAAEPAPAPATATATATAPAPAPAPAAPVPAASTVPTASPASGGSTGPAAGDADPDGQPALLELSVNGVPKQVVFALVRPGDVLVDRRDLLAAGIPAEEAPAVRSGDRNLVSLHGLPPDVSYELDDRALALRVTLAPRFLGRTRIDLGPSPRPQGMELRSDASAFLNYAVQGQTGRGINAFLEAGTSYRHGLVTSGVSRMDDGTVVRGMSSAVYDDLPELRRTTAGDAVASGLGPLGGSVLLGGVSVAREFSLDPYLIHAPLPQAQGFAMTPSVLDVYVDGLLVRQQPIAPGSYDLANLPVSAGAGTVRTVLRDAFGRTQDVSTRYYFSSGLLTKGTSDYAVQLGARRNDFGTQSFSYGPGVLVARDRVGITDALTVGGRLEALGAQVLSAGPTVTAGLPAGELELSLGASRDGDALGGGTSAAYRFTSRQASAGALMRLQSTRYATASLRADQDRATFFADAFTSVPVTRRLAATLEYTAQTFRDAGFNDKIALRGDVQLGAGVGASITVDRSRSFGGPATTGFFVLLSWGFGQRSTADAFASRSAGGSGGGVEAQQALPLGEGAGYRVRAEHGTLGDSALAQAQVQGPYGRYDAAVERIAGNTDASASIAGGLVAMDGRLFASRAVQDGYAVIDVDGVENVRGYLNNQEIGRTDSHGKLLIPSMTPYYANRISIRGTDLPLDYQVGNTERLVATSLRGGALVRFDVRVLRVISGRVVLGGPGGRRVVPAYGALKVLGETSPPPSPIGAGGEFYLEDLAPGPHLAAVESEAGACVVELRVPQSAVAIVDLGELRCGPAAAALLP